MNITKNFCLIVIVLLIGATSSAQSVNTPGNPLNDYQIFSVAKTKGIPPENVIKLDNNFEILLECQTGKTMDQLESAGLISAHSQIHLLLTWNLLRNEDDKFVTTFPILNDEDTRKVKSVIKSKTGIIGEYIKDDLKSLADKLRLLNFERSAYSIFFAYILDDLMRREFVENKIVTARQITIDQPFWNGLVWAIKSTEEYSLKSAAISNKNVTLKISWNENVSDKMNILFGEISVMSNMIKEIDKKGIVEDQQVINGLRKYGIFNNNGGLDIPYIIERNDDPLFVLCKQITQKMLDRFLRVIDFAGLTEDAHLPNELTAFIIGYHEFVREMINYTMEQNIFERPGVLFNAPVINDKNIHDLMFLINIAKKS